jgi:hypothetical protein
MHPASRLRAANDGPLGRRAPLSMQGSGLKLVANATDGMKVSGMRRRGSGRFLVVR